MTLKTERFEMRLDLKTIERLDGWRRKQDDLPSRAEAIRRLVESGLGGGVHVDGKQEEMFRLHNSGMSFNEIGLLYDLSGERVRQIVRARQNSSQKDWLSVRTDNALKSILGNKHGDPKEISKLSADHLRDARLPKKCIVEVRTFLKQHGLDLAS